MKVSLFVALSFLITGCGSEKSTVVNHADIARSDNRRGVGEAPASPATPAQAACRSMEIALDEQGRRAAAAIIAPLIQQRAPAIEVERVLREGEWIVIFATPRNAERGAFFVRRANGRATTLVDTWGGVAQPEERAEIIAWARARPGAPPRSLSKCFASLVTGG